MKSRTTIRDHDSPTDPNQRRSPPKRTWFEQLQSETHGAVMVEYVIVLVVVELVIAMTLIQVGPRLVQVYSQHRAALYQPYP